MPTDSGSQEVTLKFYDPVDSHESNERFRDIRPTGIYKGGYLTRVNDTTISLSPLVCEIRSKTTTPYYQVKVETTTAVNVTVGSSVPYVVCRWTYTGSAAADYMEMIGVASPDDRDLIVGKCTYSGSTLVGFNYAERKTPNVFDVFLKVEPEETPAMYVRIRAGRVQLNNQTVTIVDQLSGVFTAPGSGSKTGAVYIDANGSVQVSSDFTQAGPQLVLATIALTAGQTTITAANITDKRSWLMPPVIPDDTTIRYNTSTGKLEAVPHTHAQLHNAAHTHASSQYYLCTKWGDDSWAGNYQCRAQSSWTTLNIGAANYLKSSGITVNSNQITLPANKMYMMNYRVRFIEDFDNNTGGSPEVQTRFRVISGDSSWNLEYYTQEFNEGGVGGVQAEFQTSGGWYLFKPNQNTVIDLQAITQDAHNEKGEVRAVTVTIYSLEYGAAVY